MKSDSEALKELRKDVEALRLEVGKVGSSVSVEQVRSKVGAISEKLDELDLKIKKNELSNDGATEKTNTLLQQKR
jgi:hypothetical protein